ncbi:leucyl aminopeptidase family protein [Magnetospirillum molischianum]|uniref:Leucine aminopeptidase n=1 Tax=Magnetospirillum molischianum DSM 120 TaxID=1150626 RepID=H8FRV5_MAGML|nr:leucyl aminopeptidase family protein [Magnetospirillum molischianum]CCG41093.1 Leucine aminopeptidase [Magnetospirillum molischianum DSM 120]
MVTEHLIEQGAETEVVALVPLTKAGLETWLADHDAARTWVDSVGFAAESGSLCLIPGPDGRLAIALAGVADPTEDPWGLAALPSRLPPGRYRLTPEPATPRSASWAALSWTLAGYSFDRYKKSAPRRDGPDLVWPGLANRAWVSHCAEATRLVRDLVNTPAADLGPAELAGAAEALAARFGANCRTVVGDGLLVENYPAIHTVGRAATTARRPRLIDLSWGDEQAPRVTLVGKGVCFDSGGLDLKPSSSMKLMKKDMGGAAHVLGLALMIMASDLPVRLRVLIPAVENAVSAEAMRPLDVLTTRKGLTVEIGNTDAEGRLILADALCEAASEAPDLLIDIATLTGAARTALGPDLPALFCNDEKLADAILAAGRAEADPLWRLPLYAPYRRLLDSKVADIASVSDGPYAGAITAALFLQEFVGPDIAWAHLDVMAWNGATRPGRPEGGEALALRALFAVIAARFPIPDAYPVAT